MKKIIIIILFLINYVFFVNAITDGCANEVEINTACVIRTPPITCSTYDLYNSTNTLIIDDGTMEEVITNSGVYNFTFNANASGIHTIVLCDNTSTNINVETTDETDLGTILSNQATLQNNIETINETIKEINRSIIEILNATILSNMSLSRFSTTVSSADKISIGEQCAIQNFRRNISTTFIYNLSVNSSFELLNVIYNDSDLGIIVNETFFYNNLSMLNKTQRNTT